MTFDFSYVLRKEMPGAAFRELDDVVLLAPVRSDEGDTIAAGTRGTIVGIGRERFIVEFADPDGSTRLVCEGALRGLDGRTPQVRTVWIMEDDGYARFITLVPLGRRGVEIRADPPDP